MLASLFLGWGEAEFYRGETCESETAARKRKSRKSRLFSSSSFLTIRGPRIERLGSRLALLPRADRSKSRDESARSNPHSAGTLRTARVEAPLVLRASRARRISAVLFSGTFSRQSLFRPTPLARL